MKIKIILGIFFVLIILSACGIKTKSPDPVYLHIEGTVTYSDTGKPVAHCRIELWRFGFEFFSTYRITTANSDENGWYNIQKRVTTSDCAWGHLVLRVYIEGQRRWSNEQFSMNPNENLNLMDCAEGLQIINIEVEPL